MRRFVRGVWEFIVGDDWTVAAGVAVAIGLTAVLAAAGIAAWWVMPLAALGLLALTVHRSG